MPDLTSTIADPPPVPERTKPVTLSRRASGERRAYHEGYAAALDQVAEWLQDKARTAADLAAMHRTLADFDMPADPTATKPAPTE